MSMSSRPCAWGPAVPIGMPGTDGLAATERICATPDLAHVRVIMLTTFELDEYVFEALRVGASGSDRNAWHRRFGRNRTHLCHTRPGARTGDHADHVRVG